MVCVQEMILRMIDAIVYITKDLILKELYHVPGHAGTQVCGTHFVFKK